MDRSVRSVSFSSPSLRCAESEPPGQQQIQILGPVSEVSHQASFDSPQTSFDSPELHESLVHWRWVELVLRPRRKRRSIGDESFHDRRDHRTLLAHGFVVVDDLDSGEEVRKLFEVEDPGVGSHVADRAGVVTLLDVHLLHPLGVGPEEVGFLALHDDEFQFIGIEKFAEPVHLLGKADEGETLGRDDQIVAIELRADVVAHILLDLRGDPRAVDLARVHIELRAERKDR